MAVNLNEYVKLTKAVAEYNCDACKKKPGWILIEAGRRLCGTCRGPVYRAGGGAGGVYETVAANVERYRGHLPNFSRDPHSKY
mgnify:CR=1 FL=1